MNWIIPSDVSHGYRVNFVNWSFGILCRLQDMDPNSNPVKLQTVKIPIDASQPMNRPDNFVETN